MVLVNLKEAFRFQKVLEQNFDFAINEINNTSNIYKITKKHLKNKVNSDATDFEEVLESEYNFNINDIIRFAYYLAEEKGKLTKAINMTKHEISDSVADIDAMVEKNKKLQSLSNTISYIAKNYKAKTAEVFETDYKFNAEGNQTSYRYPVEMNYEERYDRGFVSKVAKESIGLADENSALIDSCMINSNVNYHPLFSVNDSFEEAIEAFLAKGENNNG